VSQSLRMKGFAVIEVGDGTAAVEEVRARADIDVILLDVMLPGIPSWEVLTEARRLRPGIKIILMSAYSRDYARRYFEGATIDGFLEKPFVLGDVLGVLRETLGVPVATQWEILARIASHGSSNKHRFNRL